MEYLLLGALLLGGFFLLPKPLSGEESKKEKSGEAYWLGRLLTSETSKESEWPWIAAAALTVARRAGLTIEGVLRRGVKGGRTYYNLPAGSQDPAKNGGYVRWASTRFEPSARALAWAKRWLDPGKRTPEEDAAIDRGPTSFLEVASISKERRETLEKSWGKPLLHESERWAYYG